MEARMHDLLRLFGKLVNPSAGRGPWTDGDWCCRSCANAWQTGRLAEARRARERLGAQAQIRGRELDSW